MLKIEYFPQNKRSHHIILEVKIRCGDFINSNQKWKFSQARAGADSLTT